jgi:hypothetical protein
MNASTSLTDLIAEDRQRWEPYADQFAKVEDTAERAWREEIARVAARRTARRAELAAYESDGMHHLVESIAPGERYRRGLDRFSTSVEELTLPSATVETLDAALSATLRVNPLTGDAIIVAIAGAGEEVVRRTELQGGPHQQQNASADRTTGRFRFLHNIGHEGGFSYAAAAIWVRFMRLSPGSPPGHGNPGLAQVRPYVPYNYLWTNKSYIAPAHGHAGFGVFVQSESLAGGGSQVDLNHRYWIYADGTSWYQQHHNPAFPDVNDDHALTFNDRAPWFIIRPGRIYSAAVWCFGECDAHGADLIQASFAAALIDARMPFVVVAQTKN